MTLHKHNATRPGSARPANAGDYHIAYKDGMYKVYDKAGRFRLSFATLPAAQTYISQRTAATHPEAQSS